MITQIKHNFASPDDSMISHFNDAHSTGLMHGDTKGAWVPDIGATSVTAPATIPDRSKNRKSLNVNGTLTLNQVATNSELRAFSGFSAANYLEQPYNADLDFGTGDFYVMGWFKAATISRRYIFQRYSASLINFAFRIDDTTGYLSGTVGPLVTDGVTTNTNVCDDSWHFGVFARSGGTLLLYLDGASIDSISNSVDISDPDGVVTVGLAGAGDRPFTGSLALWRIGAGAPSAEQIKEIYETEKKMFQEDSKITLSGTSDSVLALDYDDDTDLLTVHTDVQDRFQGLVNVAQSSITGTAKAVSTSGGRILSGTSTTVAYYEPAQNLREELSRIDEARDFYGSVPQQFWFDNLVTNGGFDTDTDWTLTTNTAISGGVLSFTSAGYAESVFQNIGYVAGDQILISMDITVTSGTIHIYLGGTSTADYRIIMAPSTGTYTFSGVSPGTDGILYIRSLAVGTIATVDNVSVREADADGNTIYPLPNGFETTAVYQEGVLKREGAAQDYELKKSPTGAYEYIQLAVAPGVDDEICVMAVRRNN